jgi:hypothetical protein
VELPLLAAAAASPTPAGGIEVVRTLDGEREDLLGDHRIEGRPVFPFAGAMELMAETAAAARPGLEVAALRGIRVLQGIALDDETYAVRAAAVPAAAAPGSAATFEASIAALDGGRPHYRASVDLREPAAPAPAVAAPGPLDDLAPFPMTVDDAYRDLLFHGPLFQRIGSIEGMDARGASSVILPSPPEACVRGAAGEWLLDPVLVDCALQLQVIWARLHWDVTLLPASIGGVVRAGSPAAAGGEVRHELRIRPESAAPMCHCDHWFYAADGRLLLAMTDVQGIGSRALNRLAGATTA